MKIKYYNIILLTAILFLSLKDFTYAQEYSPSMISSYCAVNGQPNYDVVYPMKPPVCGTNLMRILIVYVQFNNETFDPGNTIWPVNTTDGPSYKGTMLAEYKNDITDWWNAYNPQTQSVSS